MAEMSSLFSVATFGSSMQLEGTTLTYWARRGEREWRIFWAAWHQHFDRVWAQWQNYWDQLWATAELKKNGKFNAPGVVLLKKRMVATEESGKKEMFGKTVILKAKPRRKIVKAFPAAALKARI